MSTWLLAVLAASAAPVMPKLQLPRPDYQLDAGKMCFPSGLLVHVVARPNTDVVAITTVIGGGSSAETEATRGAAHLVEHLWFRSKPGGGPTVYDLEAGLQIGGATYTDATVYTTVGAGADLQALLALEGQRLLDPLQGIDEAILREEQEIIASELAWRGDHSERAALRTLDSRLWPEGHPYATALVPLDEARSRSLEQLHAYTAAAYRPANTAIRIEGAVDFARIQDQIFAAIPQELIRGPDDGCGRKRAAEPPPAPATTAPVAIEGPVLDPRMYVAWSLPAAFGPDETKMRLAVRMLEDDVWRRLAFVRGITLDDTIGVGCDFIPGRLASKAVCVFDLPDRADPNQTLQAIKAELPALWEQDHQLLRIEQLAETVGSSYASAFAQLDALDRDNLQMRGFATWMGQVDPLAPVIDTVLTVNEKEVAAFSQQYLTADRAVAVLLVPGDAPIETGRGIGPTARLDAPPVPVWHAPRPRWGLITSSKLSNGIDTWVVARPDTTYLAMTALVWPGGWATSPVPGTNEVIEALQVYSIPVAFGELRRTLGVVVGNGFGSQANDRTTWGAAGNLDLQLWLHHVMWAGQQMDFSGRQNELDPQVERAFETFRESPWGTTRNLRTEHLIPGDRAGRAWWDGVRTARSVGSKQVYAWERTVYQADTSTLVMAGHLTSDVAVAEAEKYLGAIKSKKADPVPPLPALPPVPERQVFVLDAPTVQADVIVTCRLPGRTEENAAAHAVLLATIERGMWQTLREDGGTYGITTTVDHVDPRLSLLTMRAGVRANEGADALLAMLDLVRLVRERPPEPVVAWGRQEAAGQHARDFATAANTFSTLRVAAAEGRSLASLQGYADDLAAVDAGALSSLLEDCAGHEAATIVGPSIGEIAGVPTRQVDWKAYGAALADSLK